MTVLFTDNLPLLAGAPNGIKKLRELILELAVRGKLVPQDPGDEPASELLRRITEEKARLVAEWKLKKQKALPGVPLGEAPYDLPVRWEWTRLGEITNFGATTKKDEIPDDAWVLDLEDIEKDTSRLLRKARFFERNSLSDKNSFNKGDVLYGKLRPYLNKVLVAEDDGFCTTEILPFRCHGPFVARYFMIVLKSPHFINYVNAKSYGMKMPRLGTEDGRLALFPLPPLAEQQRIVTKVDELMTLCDSLEAQQANAESAHAQLVQALLDSLSQASDADDFATNWQRLAEYFHILFITESSIDALKQTLLQLAVMGKLVPQDPSDAPASELLKRMADGTAELVRNGLLKTPKPLPNIKQDEIPYELPPTWRWVRLGDISEFINGDRGKNYPNRTEYVSEGIPWINTGHIEPDGTLSQDCMHFITRAKFESLNGGKIRIGDLVYCLRGATFGKTAIVDPYSEGAIASSLMIIRPFEPCSNRYMYRYLTSQIGRDQIFRFDNGSAQPNLSANNVRLYVYPLPPLAEQHRIVVKVDQLIALCNQLRTRLTQAHQLNEQFASTLVERVLINGHEKAPVFIDPQTARKLLAAEITHQLHAQRTFGQRKLQKVIYLAEHAARLAAIQGNYLRNVAGPHDRQLMNQVEGELQKHQWYERIERETVGHAYRPLSQAGRHRRAYESIWSEVERSTIERVIELMRSWDTDRCEMTVTLYAVWNDFILEGRPVTDEAIVNEVMHRWSDTKLRFSKAEWLAVLADMKKHEILMPTGFGKRTTGGMLSLAGFE